MCDCYIMPQETVLSIGLAAVLAGRRGYTAIAEWAADLTQAQLKRLRARLNPRTERFEPPSEPTLRRVLQTYDAPAVDAALSDWLLGVTHTDDAVAVDGKALRGAIRPDGTQVHLLSAFLQEQGVTVAQREIPTKTNEIPEIKPLLQPLDLVTGGHRRCAAHPTRNRPLLGRGQTGPLPSDRQRQPAHPLCRPQRPDQAPFPPQRRDHR